MKELNSFTVDRLKDLINQYVHEEYNDVSDEEVIKLVSIALAAKRAEPVAWVVGDATLYNSDTVEAYAKRSGLPVSPLYTTPQLDSQVPLGSWIKCSDHRPERGTDVQAYCSDTREQFVAFHLGNGEFQYAQHEDTSIACRPSHWMPLPAAPEKPL